MTAEYEENVNAPRVPVEKQSGIEISKKRPPAVPGGKDVMERSDSSLAARDENQPAMKPDSAVTKN
jgi:hypothetical protein